MTARSGITPTHLQESARLHLRGLEELEDRATMLETKCAVLEHHLGVSQSENTFLREALAKSNAERDAYERYSITMTAKLDNAVMIFEDLIKISRDAAFLKASVPSAAQQAVQADPSDQPEVPKFLTQQLDQKMVDEGANR